MNILIIEDNVIKREKIRDFISNSFEADIFEAASYNSGVNVALAQRIDLIVLDMSMPTFDRTESTHGGRFRTLAGKDVVVRLLKANRLVPFVVVTGYRDFSVNSRNHSIAEIDEILHAISELYKGCILFETTDSEWQEQLATVIRGV